MLMTVLPGFLTEQNRPKMFRYGAAHLFADRSLKFPCLRVVVLLALCVLDIKVEYTADGSLWQVIQDNIAPEVNQIEWVIPTDAARSARYRIRVVASDGKQTAEAVNNKVFGVNSTPVIYTAQVQNLLNAKCATACHE